MYPTDNLSPEQLKQIVDLVNSQNYSPKAFIINIGINLIVAILAGLFAIKFSKKLRWFVTGMLGRISHSDIEFVFDNKNDAKKDIEREIKRSKKLYILTSRGNELQRDPFSSYIKNRTENKLYDIRIILPKTNLKEFEFDFTKQREDELTAFENLPNNMKNKINENANDLKKIINNDKKNQIELRRVNMPHFCRIIITDNHLFLQPYNRDIEGSMGKVMKYNKGETYLCFNRYFDLLWRSADEQEIN